MSNTHADCTMVKGSDGTRRTSSYLTREDGFIPSDDLGMTGDEDEL